MNDLEQLAEAVADQQHTLDCSIVASTIVLNLLTEIGRRLLVPLTALRIDDLAPEECADKLRELREAAVAVKDTMGFALLTFADIEQHAGIEREDWGGDDADEHRVD